MFDSLFNAVSDLYVGAQSLVYECCMQPIAFRLGWGGLMEDGYEASGCRKNCRLRSCGGINT